MKKIINALVFFCYFLPLTTFAASDIGFLSKIVWWEIVASIIVLGGFLLAPKEYQAKILAVILAILILYFVYKAFRIWMV